MVYARFNFCADRFAITIFWSARSGRFTIPGPVCILRVQSVGEGMAERRIYAGHYKRYDGKVIYVVTTAKDADTGEETVIWTPSLYANARQYFTMSKRSFCGDVEVDGKRQAKFKRQTSMRLSDAAAERYEEEGLRGPARKRYSAPTDGYDAWEQPRPRTYYEYAKALCEGYRLGLRKYQLCVSEKKYIAISKKDFLALEQDLRFLNTCMKTVLKDYAGYFDERFIQGSSIRKYAQAHSLNRGSVDHLQRKFFTALAAVLKERDEAEGTSRLLPEK